MQRNGANYAPRVMSKTPAKEPDPVVIAFMERVMAALKMDTPQLQQALVDDKYLRVSQIRSVNRWVAGTAAPNFRSTLYLLERAQLLKPEVKRRADAAADAKAALAHLDVVQPQPRKRSAPGSP